MSPTLNLCVLPSTFIVYGDVQTRSIATAGGHFRSVSAKGKNFTSIAFEEAPRFLFTCYHHVQVSHLINGIVVHWLPLQLRLELIHLLHQPCLDVRIHGQFVAKEAQERGGGVKASKEENQTLCREVVILPH